MSAMRHDPNLFALLTSSSIANCHQGIIVMGKPARLISSEVRSTLLVDPYALDRVVETASESDERLSPVRYGSNIRKTEIASSYIV